MTRYCPKIYREKNRITIGWIGSRSTFSYLGRIKGVLEKIGERYQNVELKIVADKFFDCKNIPVVKSKWSYDSEIDDLQSFDIGLMPLTDNAWTRGKCGFKLIQCMAVQVPVICSPVGMNREIVQHGVNGLWANNSEEWIKGLSTLIETPTMREKLGVNGRKTVQEKYSLELNAMRLAGLLKNCIQGTNHADDQD
jgi:glycosyltransferase involved in cell wall biosynthesis